MFVGGLDPNVSEDDLRQTFSQYGEIASVKIPVGKQCGFVQFVVRYISVYNFKGKCDCSKCEFSLILYSFILIEKMLKKHYTV